MVSLRQNRLRRPGNILIQFLILLFVVLCGVLFFLFFEGNKPTVNLSEIPAFIGKTDTLEIDVADIGSGLRHIEITVSQGNTVKEVYNHTFPRLKYTGQIGPLSDRQTLKFDAKEFGFTEGPVNISVIARDFSLRGLLQGNRTTATVSVTLDTQPPTVKILHSEQYISPGGAGIAIYSVTETDSKHGVVINGKFNQGHPAGKNSKDTYIAYFALPYDAPSLQESYVVATDSAGNSALLPFSTKFQAAKQKHDRINISDGFLSAKIPEFEQYYPNLPGDLLEKYIYTNQTIRDENNLKIAEICSTTDHEQLWDGAVFQRMPGSNRAGYADHRTYYYNDQAIDKQVHLGMDIASTQHAGVEAANRGKVVFAGYLGIYGNMVVIDHGQGIFSLYSHLSQINAKVGTMVTVEDSIGLTGTTGMAGGDHLHFSMLINGIFTTPLEWWDPHWIKVTISDPLLHVKL